MTRPAGWIVAVVALAYASYLALLIACDLWRVAPLGFVPVFAPDAVMLGSVQPGTAAARAGLQPLDRIARANGQVVQGRVDWQRVRVHLDPATPLDLELVRDGATRQVRLPLGAGLQEWRTGPSRSGLIAFRFAQVVTLGFALVVGFRRSSQPSALVGACMLASFATLSLSLPAQLFLFWRQVPQPLQSLLWVPYTTSAAVGPLLFAFFAVFPRRTWSVPALLALLVPGALCAAWYAYVGARLWTPPGAPTGLPDLTGWVFASSAAYAFAAVGQLVLGQRALAGVTDRRRVGVLLGGTGIGVAAGALLLVLHRLEPGADIFGHPIMTGLALMSLAVPASFAYAILWHRLFDLSLLARQGVRYALARWLLDALIPIVVAVIVADVALHGDESLASVLRARWWWYVGGMGTLLVLRSRRDAWLVALDRRFFRERYDAERLLKDLVARVASAPGFEDTTPAVVRQIEEALHPVFVHVLEAGRAANALTPVAGSPERAAALPSSLAILRVLSALRKPLVLELGDSGWLRYQLPEEERLLLVSQQIDLLVPIFGGNGGDPPRALLVLGERRSEEPYGREDLELLASIADGLGLLLARTPQPAQGLAECSVCGRCVDGDAEVCPTDGGRLDRTGGARVLNGRYRLERRLGRGGMGTVYDAVDEVLDRRVAVKVIREDVGTSLAGDGPWTGMDVRFRLEARAGAAFTDPHVVRVYDFGVDPDRRAFLVMELLEGRTLRQRLATGVPMPPDEVLAIVRDVARALTAAHGQGLLHRDLKPENIFLVGSGDQVMAKVLDFGLAKALAGARPSGAGGATQSSAGVLLGTLDYMAPEQVAGDVVSPSWDVWALTVITFEMLTLRHPFRRTVMVADPGGADAVVPSHLPNDAPPAVAAFFAEALSTEPGRRPPTPLGLLAACQRVLS